MLGKAETELQVGFFMKNAGVGVHAVDPVDESEEGESAGYVIYFV